MDRTAFESLLQEYAPQIYRLAKLAEVDTHLWELIDLILVNNTNQITGDVSVRYSRGFIYELNQTVRIIADKANRPGYTTEDADEARLLASRKRGA